MRGSTSKGPQEVANRSAKTVTQPHLDKDKNEARCRALDTYRKCHGWTNYVSCFPCASPSGQAERSADIIIISNDYFFVGIIKIKLYYVIIYYIYYNFLQGLKI